MQKIQTPEYWNIKANKLVTKFANAQSRAAYNKMGDGVNKIVYVPGIVEDHPDFVNTAFGSLNGGPKPDYDNPIARFDVTHDTNGLPSLNNIFYDSFAENVKAIDDAVAQYGYKRGLEHIATANIVSTTTISTTKALNILDRVLGLQTRSYFLELAVTKIPAPQLVFTVDTMTDGSVQAKVPEMLEADLISHSESRSTQTLFKNVGHIAESEEAQMMASHNTMALRQDKTIRDMARLLNAQIATEMETATDVGAGDWGALDATYFVSNRNPAGDIQGVVTTIRGNGFNVDYMAMHDRPATDFLTNDHIKGKGAQSPGFGTEIMALNQNVINVTGFPTLIIDQAKTATIATVGSRDAVWLGDGPTIVANYENVQAGFRGWLIKSWKFPYLSQAGAIRDLTSVSA
jgi:hypothetical protein